MVFEGLFVLVVQIVDLFEPLDWNHEGFRLFCTGPGKLDFIKRRIHFQRLNIVSLERPEEWVPQLRVVSDS